MVLYKNGADSEYLIIVCEYKRWFSIFYVDSYLSLVVLSCFILCLCCGCSSA